MNYSKLISFIIVWQLLYGLNLSGIIYDEHSIGIENASVTILENSLFSTTTNSNGEFFINNIDPLLITISVSHIGFTPVLSKINLEDNSEIEIILYKEIIDLDRIVVTGTRSERHIKNTPILTHVISSEDISFSSYSNVKDILEMAMPNVQSVTSNHGNDRVKIQGLDNKYLTFLVDGDRVSGEYAGNLDFSMLGLSNVEKIEVIEGAMSTLYGSGSIGGVVNIITKKNKEPYWINTGIQYDSPIATSSYLNAGFNRGILNYNFNLQFTESDGYDLTPDSQNEYNMTLDENRSEIFNHNITFSPSLEHKIGFLFKDYSSRINGYKYYDGNLIVDAPLNRYDDKYYKVKYQYKISSSQIFKISFIEEEYTKHYYYPYYYSENQIIYNPEEFVNAILDRQEINLQYNFESTKYKRLIGLESYNEDYSSFNIFYPNGLILQESIFEGTNLTKSDNSESLYFYEERSLFNDNILSIGLRVLNKPSLVLPSLSYLLKGYNDYNYRFSYSEGYRKPSIKERFYKWQDHAGPDIVGNPDLNATENNYFSISLDKRTIINDFSLDLYRNNILNMISTEYDLSGNLLYINYDKVAINGINIHYYRKIRHNLKLKFVYNLTDASSSSSEILEGISKHAIRLNLYYELFNDLDLVANVKYIGAKFIYDQEQGFVGNSSLIDLPGYFISDIYLNFSSEFLRLKVGIKNIFDYKDPSRFSTEILNNYDPGRRFFIEFNLDFKKDNNVK